MSLEDDLRRTLQTRANDVTPDPATFARVQTRIRRQRTFRLAFAGLATALAVSGIALAAPGLIDRRIEFEPGPVATAPAPDATASPAVSEPSAGPVPADTRLVFTDGESVQAMALDGESAEELMRSDYAPSCPAGFECQPVQSVAALPGQEITAVAAEGCNGVRSSSSADETLFQDTCPSSVSFSPSGGHLAWISEGEPEGEPMLHTVDWTGDGPGQEDASLGLPWADVSEVSIQDWITTGDGMLQGELILRGRRNGVIQLVRLPIEQQPDGALAVPYGPAPPVEARPGFVPLAFAASGTGVEHTLEARQEPDGYAEETIVRRIGTEIDAQIAAPADLFDGPDFNESDLWMSDNGAALAFGNAATGKAWYLLYSPEKVGEVPRQMAATVRRGELIVMPPPDLPTEPAAPSTTVEVDVYFGMEGADACSANQQVTREVQAPGVAVGAVSQLLQGPSSRESNEGIVSPFSANTADALIGIVISNGVAEVDLADFRDVVGDDSCTKSAILDALDKTLKQFPTVTSTRYLFDGDARAWETWLGASPEAPPFLPDFVHETYDDILAAARSRNWDALARLSSETSCTFSDQKEPCVPHWQKLEEQGEDPLGVLVDTLEREAARNPDAPIWVWPAEHLEGGYLGPRVGIREDGVWMYFVLGGD